MSNIESVSTDSEQNNNQEPESPKTHWSDYLGMYFIQLVIFTGAMLFWFDYDGLVLQALEYQMWFTMIGAGLGTWVLQKNLPACFGSVFIAFLLIPISILVPDHYELPVTIKSQSVTVNNVNTQTVLLSTLYRIEIDGMTLVTEVDLVREGETVNLETRQSIDGRVQGTYLCSKNRCAKAGIKSQ